MENILENKRIRNSIKFLINFLTQWNVEYSGTRDGLKYFRLNLVTILLIQVSLGMIQEYQYIDCHQSPANTWKLKITIHQNLTAIFAVTHQLVIMHIGRYELLDICWTSFLILWWRFLFEHRRLKWPTQVYYLSPQRSAYVLMSKRDPGFN